MKIDNVKYSHLTITSGADENYSSSNWFEMELDGKFALFAIHTDDAQVKTVLNEKSDPVAKWTVAQPYVLQLLVINAIDHAIEESHAMQKEKFNTDTYTVIKPDTDEGLGTTSGWRFPYIAPMLLETTGFDPTEAMCLAAKLALKGKLSFDIAGVPHTVILNKAAV
jgi:hypothetical protein